MVGTILVAEDDDLLRDFILSGLVAEGFVTVGARDGGEALHFALSREFDLFVLDRNLPDMDGLHLLGEIRSRGVLAPAMFLTAMGAVDDRVRGLDSGADDYMAKPFVIAELLARTRALLRRPKTPLPDRLTAGALTFDLRSQAVLYADQEVDLTAQDRLLLSAFMRDPQRVFTREALLDHMEGGDDITPAAVEHAISRLRKKLDLAGAPSLIETVRGLGYRFSA